MTPETTRPHGKPGRSGPPGNQNARKHGSYRATAELKELVRSSMDGRTTEAREVAVWVGNLVADLGGTDNLSTQKKTVVLLAGQTVLQLARVDAFLARMPSLVHRKRRQLYPIVLQRQTLVNTLRQLLNDLGLERQARQVPTLDEYLRSRANGTPTPAVAAVDATASPTPADAANAPVASEDATDVVSPDA